MWDYRPILKIFTKEPEGSFTIRELAGKANMAYGSAHKCISEILAKESVVTLKSHGKSKVVKLNLEFMSTPQYLSEAEIEIERTFRKANKKFYNNLTDLIIYNFQSKAKHSIFTAVLFGSWVKGKAVKSSDIDLLLIGPDNIKGVTEEIIPPWEFEHDVKVNPVIQTPEDYIKSLKTKALLPVQIISNHIVLMNSENYWRLTVEGLKR